MGGVLHRLAGRPTAVAGGLLVGGWILVALFANLIAPYDPLHSIQPLVPPGGFDAIGGSHWLGTDYLGRDILSRLVVGARSVILLATAATLTAYCVGIAGGLAAGYFRGWTDSALSFLSNVVLSFPILVLYIVVIVAIGASAANVILAVTFGSAPAIFRIVRTITMDIASRDFVAASVIQGETVLRILAVDNPAQRDRAAGRRFLPTPRLHGDHHRRLGFPGPRPAAADAGLGWHGKRGSYARFRLPLPRAVSLSRDLLAGAGVEPARRRAARGGRPPR